MTWSGGKVKALAETCNVVSHSVISFVAEMLLCRFIYLSDVPLYVSYTAGRRVVASLSRAASAHTWYARVLVMWSTPV